MPTERRARTAALVVALVIASFLLVVPGARAADPCNPLVNAIACENSKPGSPASEWDVSSGGDPSIVGFATDISVNVGQTVRFKINTDARAYTIDIYRLGYYGGDGARKIASVSPPASLPQNQPSCLSDSTTGLVDCGNWAESASWAVPATAVSGIYLALLTRTDTGKGNHIPFVVRDDASHSDLLFQTSDTTWQAYNDYGGNSLYFGEPAGRAYKVSYNRPIMTRATGIDGRNSVLSAEYPMVRFLEANGYDVSYSTGVDTARRGGLLTNHKTFMSVGHDEYWSGEQRANVEAARDAGVNLAFFSGNEVYWKTRWEPSISAGAASYRTLVSYKETKANAVIDPADPPTWTGTWRDPRFSPPADGGRPENALTGTFWTVECCTSAIQVPAAFGQLRFWRNTSIASLAAGQVATLTDGTLGYEWDEDVDNGFRPAGLIQLSSTTENVQSKIIDYGSTVAPGTATHSLTLYRAPSGALVFGAGTVQWSWGLDSNHEGTGGPADIRMQQATVNLLADMGAQPGTRQPGLVAASASTDTTAPTSAISSPAAGTTVPNGTTVTLTGTATDAGGGRVGGVEVSTDGGTTWHRAKGTTSWTYDWSPTGRGQVTVKSRAADDSGNIETPSAGRTYDVTCPCSIFSSLQVPGQPSTDDATAIEAGVKFRSDVDGWITGVRFYKGSGNTGTHTGSLWTTSGQQLATATFTNETSSGWQTVSFSSPVPVTAGTTYVASYFAPAGHYAADTGWFANSDTVSPPLRALANGVDGPNGVFRYGGSGFPTDTYSASNYWVDVVFTTTAPPDSSGPTVTAVSPVDGTSSVPVTTTPAATFSEAVQPSSIVLTVKNAAGTAVTGAVAYDSTSRKATFTPAAALANDTTYTATVSAAKDIAGNSLAAPKSWSFTTVRVGQVPGSCPCSMWDDSDTPATVTVDDGSAVELGVRFQADTDGFVTGVRFYKGPQNTGTHTGSLWSASGQRLATATFANESSSGWQQVSFSSPVAVTAGTTYTVSYHTNVGFYSATTGQYASGVDRPPLHVPAGGGAFVYGTSAFPSQGSTTNYWVDVVFTLPNDTTAPTVTSTDPGDGATSVPVTVAPSATFSEAVTASTIAMTVTGPSGSVAGSTSYASATRRATFTPSAALAAGTRYTVSVSGATDAAGNVMAPRSWSFTTSGITACPCSVWSTSQAPGTVDSGDGSAVELGVKFRASQDGFITGVRYYKSAANTGTHVGTLWSSTGAKLASATFSGESSSGWQTVTFTQPVAVTAGATYVASYHTDSGHYAVNVGYFANAVVNGPLTALASGTDGPNGVFHYGASAFPTDSYQASNYWVDAVFTTDDTLAPEVTATSPDDGAGSVSTSTTVTATFNEAVTPSSVSIVVKSPSGATVAGATSYASSTRTSTFTPSSPLSAGTTYDVTVSGATDLAGNVATPTTWSFTTAAASPPPGTCPCSLWADTATPGTPAAGDSSAVELGVRFSTSQNGVITGVRFYKGPGNTGTHTGSLWSAGGTLLATATFTGESSSGWQTVTFSNPVPVSAGTTYVASYHTSTGHYAVDTNYFTSALTRGPLTAPASIGSAPNGVYRYGAGGFPSDSWRASNYWVDVVFATTA